jgi:hypothetical protein
LQQPPTSPSSLPPLDSFIALKPTLNILEVKLLCLCYHDIQAVQVQLLLSL